jgi:hypothetical protein
VPLELGKQVGVETMPHDKHSKQFPASAATCMQSLALCQIYPMLLHLQERLLVERSGKTFFETAGLMGTLKTLSRSFLGPRPPLHGLR